MGYEYDCEELGDWETMFVFYVVSVEIIAWYKLHVGDWSWNILICIQYLYRLETSLF